MRLATLLHFLLTLPFPRVHCRYHHSRRWETGPDGSLWIVCNDCPNARPVNLHLTAHEISERKVN